MGAKEVEAAQALLETTAEVLAGLEKAYEQFEQRTEPDTKSFEVFAFVMPRTAPRPLTIIY